MKAQKQHTLWLLAAMAAPLAHFARWGWLPALTAVLVVLPLTRIPKDWEGMSLSLAAVESLWLGLVAGSLLSNSAAYWPSDQDFVVPLTLLALAAVTGSAAAPRVGAAAALCMVLPAIPAVCAGAVMLEPAWLRPGAFLWPWGLTLVLLLPNLPSARGSRGKGIGLLTLALSVLVQGILGFHVAAALPDAFYQTARSLGYLEPVIAVGLTLSWYTMAVFLLDSARFLMPKANVLPVCTAAAAILARVQLTHPFWALFSAVLWVFAPFLTKMKKVEKN